MPLPLTSRADLDRHLDGLGIGTGDRLVVHSRLLSFGRIEGGAATVLDLVLGRIGPAGTVIVPTYTFDSTRIFDPAASPGEGMGALSEAVRQSPGARRSRCPIHNHAGLGPGATVLGQGDPSRSLGPGSDFEALARAGFDLVLLGCDFNEGCTFLHHVEALAGVPYRGWTVLDRRVMGRDGAATVQPCHYFARAGQGLVTDFEPAERAMERAGLMRRIPCAMGFSLRCGLADLERVATAMLAADPHALVRGGP